MGKITWLLGGVVIISIVMISALVYSAVAGDGGSGSWILAVVWFVGMVLIVGAVLRGVAMRSVDEAESSGSSSSRTPPSDHSSNSSHRPIRR